MTMTDRPITATTISADAGTAPTPTRRHWTGADADSPWIALARSLVPQLAERAAEHDRDGTFAADGIALVAEHGLLSMLVPEEEGGGGASHAEACAVLAELAHGCPATALTLSMHSHLIAAQVWRHRRGMAAPVLSRVAEHRLMLISTGASDWLESSGTARRVDGGYVVSARKMPSSGCPAGDVLVTSVRWDDAPDGPQVIHCSIPFVADGISIETTWDAMGMRATGSDTVVLDEVFVPEGAVALVRPADEWHPVWATVLGAALPLIMSAYVGAAETIADRALELAAGRAERPDVAPTAGRMVSHLAAARDAVAAMIAASDDLRFDNTPEAADTALIRKSNAAEACMATASLAFDVGGGAAFSRSVGVERLFRDIQAARFHPLPQARQQRFTGRLALGLDPLA